MAHDPILQSKQAYLNLPFLIARNVVGAVALFGIALYFVYLMVRPDLELTRAASDDDPGRARWRAGLTAGWIGQEAEEVRSWHRLQVISPALILVYAVVMSMFAIDWAMSLEPHWYSTLFGGWFFMGAFWAGIAVTAVAIARLIPLHADFRTAMGLQQRHDLGKLAFGFTVFWTYLFWSQYIVIWYGKLPWEQAWDDTTCRCPLGHPQRAHDPPLLCGTVHGVAGQAGQAQPRDAVTFLQRDIGGRVVGTVDAGGPVPPP